MSVRGLLLAVVAASLLVLAGGTARAQQETFEIGLSTDTLAVGTNFAGAQLVVFGVLDNADVRTLRQGRYDIVVVLEGPRSPLVVRERDRVAGLWINRGAERFLDVPQSYTLSATRPLRDITTPDTLRQLNIGAANLAFNRSEPEDVARRDYATALIRLRGEAGLFQETTGTIQFVSQTLFRASLTLPPDIPVGRHTVRAFLFREGTFLHGRTDSLRVRQTGFEARLSSFATRNGTAYGFAAVFLAFAVGWLGRVLFKRD